MLRPAIAAHIYFCNTAQVNQIPVDPTNLDLNNSVLMLVRSQARQFTQICATGRLTVSKVMGYYQYVSGGCRITWVSYYHRALSSQRLQLYGIRTPKPDVRRVRFATQGDGWRQPSSHITWYG